MEAPPSNQDGLHRIQVIQRTQEVFGRTLKNVLGLLQIEWVIFVILRAIPVFDGDAIAD